MTLHANEKRDIQNNIIVTENILGNYIDKKSGNTYLKRLV